MIDEKINLLKSIGLTDAESKVYLTLIKYGNTSGYEASKLSGVPRSKIYNTLESLVRKGFILFSEKDGNTRYASIPINEISEKIKRDMNYTLDELDIQLKDYEAVTDLEYIWHIKEYNNVFAKCRNIINSTEKELLIQIWEEDISEILDEVVKMQSMGIKIGVVFFSENEKSTLPLNNYVKHGMLKQKYEEMGGRFITLVSDNKQVVFGQILSGNVAEVIWTKSKPMISMAGECVRHDMYFYRSADICKDEMKKELGNDYSKIRDIF